MRLAASWIKSAKAEKAKAESLWSELAPTVTQKRPLVSHFPRAVGSGHPEERASEFASPSKRHDVRESKIEAAERMGGALATSSQAAYWGGVEVWAA